MNIWNKAYGVLMGVAVGDSLGMPSELWSRRKVKEHFGEINDFLPGPEGHFVAEGMQAGEVTDDTNQAVKIAEAIIEEKGEIKPEKIAAKLLEWVKENNAFANNMLGPSSSKALQRIADGEPVELTGKEGNTNGAAMRISPVGIISSISDLNQLVDNTEKTCLPTHHTDVAVAGAAGIASAVSAAMEGKDLDYVFNIAVKAMKMGYKRGKETFGPSLVERTYWALRIVEESTVSEEALEKLYNLIGTGVAVAQSIPTSLAIVKLAGGDPIEAGLMAANLGGDCDTIGAIAGGICGGYMGIDGIPDYYINKIREVNNLNLDKIAKELIEYRY
ncbi:MAG: ADP-ribosylglycohydrolase family protein [Bacillota bacterium]